MDRFELSRRRMLHLTGGALAASPMAGSLAAQADRPVAEGHSFPSGVELPDKPPQRPRGDSVGIAIIGLGNYALGQMMPAFSETSHCHIAAVVSGNRSKAERVASTYGLEEDAIYSYDSFDRIAEDDRIDAVYIVLPSGLHADWAVKAFRAGKHVLCEKPMALTSGECERMIAASEAANRKLMIAYRCHFEPHNLKAMELMQENAVGPIRTLRTAHHYVAGMTTPEEDWRHDRQLAGGGPLEDYGIYGLQAALYLTGEMPETISATTFQPENDPRFRQIFALTTAELAFPSGATAQLSTSYDAHAMNVVDVYGQEGALLMESATGYSGQDVTLVRNGDRRSIAPGNPRVQFAGELDHFAKAVQNGTAIKTPGEMGLRDVRLMEAIYHAAETASTVRIGPDGRMQRH